MKTTLAVPIVARWKWILFLAALLAMTAYWFLNEPARETTISQSHTPIAEPSARRSGSLPTGADVATSESGRDRVDLFALRNWEPPPPPVVSTPAPPPPPQAPPIPFKFFGRIVDAGQTPSFILTRGTEMITVRIGDRIEPAYLIDKFDGTQLHLVYLPLNIRQTIFVGNANE